MAAGSAKEAMLLAEEHRPSLVFMDVDMPEMNGVDCCRACKFNPELRKIPIVLIGGDGSAASAAKASGGGGEVGVVQSGTILGVAR